MDIVLTSALPLFALIGLGYWVGKLDSFPESGVKGIILFVWYLAMPALIYKLMSVNPLPDLADTWMLSGFLIPMVVLFMLTVLILGSFFNHDYKERAMYAYSISFGNKAYMGIPLTYATFGDVGLRVNILILSTHEVILILLAVLVMAADPKQKKSILNSLKEAGLGFMKNPVILSIAFAMLASAYQYTAPSPLLTLVDLLAPAAAPAGLFALGASLASVNAKGDRVQASVAAGAKLFLFPLMVYTTTQIMNISGTEQYTLLLLSCLPTGLNAFNYAVTVGTGSRRAASTILYSTLVSMITVSLFLLFISGRA
ncbi:AEC family transporter [Temperatibacter marinus]|uniref:AEC family transporter n=1 Tax=Temperatibacter marinus TaxID=1456591 RepID=A0AA52EI62_9PROT|nr:AEC family transporter [Temperatibacter marinus]WND03235.1 AEC family transporter [Temperatibacter marinus]